MKTKNIVNKIIAVFILSSFSVAAQINDKEMVTVPAGEFTMGCDDSNGAFCMGAATPQHKVNLSAFKIDKYLVTYKRYNECAADPNSGCTPLYEGAGCNAGMPWNTNHPVNCVDYSQAEAFCKWDGNKRLPTEAEWEKAARGTDARLYPWGNEKPDCNKLVMNKKQGNATMGPGCGAGTTRPVGSKPAGASPYGAMDMEGEVFEWTQDWYDPNYFANSPTNNPKGPATGEHKVIKGSSWLIRSDNGVLSSNRSGYSPLGQGYVVGFRCAKSI